jgi:GR25 family glycosyltransferase involved in LPS biosynthesis
MERRLKRYGVDFTFFDACEPTDVRGTFDAHLSPTQRACTYSHLQVMRRLLESGAEAALILEDDILFRSDWLSIVNTKCRLLETEDPQWDAVFLNVSEPYDVLEQWHVARRQCLAGAYILRKSAAEWILSRSAKYDCIDWMTQLLQERGHSYTYYPWLAIQQGEDTFNGTNVSADWEKVKRCLKASEFGLHHYDF